MKSTSPRWLAAALCVATLTIGPLYLHGQQNQSSQAAPAPAPTQTDKPSSTSTLGFRPRTSFPGLWQPYFMSPMVPQASMGNSQRLRALIQNGKLDLSLDEAIALALENNLDIAVARYQLPLAQADYLRTKAGGAARGVQGAVISNALFAGAIGGNGGGGGGGGTGGAGGITGGGGTISLGSAGCCDPFAGFSLGWSQETVPLNSLVVSGIPVATSHFAGYSTFYGQGFLTGTSYVLDLNGTRTANNQQFQLFNPSVPAFFGITVSQPLLNGFGYRANAAQLRIARNDLRIADSVFRQQVITTVAAVLNLYYALLSDKEQIRVAQQAVDYAQRLLADNKRQVEIGTLAPIEVVRAESEVATDQQNLVVAQTTYREDQEKLKTAISKHVEPELAAADVELTDKLPEPRPDDILPLEQALKEAVKNRPEVEQADLNLRGQGYTIQATRNRLLPSLNTFASFADFGLSGNRPSFGPCPTGTNFSSTSQLCVGPAGALAPPIVGTQAGGALEALTQVLHRTYPDYSFGATLSIPIRNRQAQADAATALLQERQLKTQLQQKRNQVEQDVRNAEIAVTQAKAQIAAAMKAKELANETLEAEKKKFQLGESTVFFVIQAQRDLTTAEGNEAKARATYAQALVQFSQATADILDRYNIQMAEAKTGEVHGVPNIPGTPTASAGGDRQR